MEEKNHKILIYIPSFTIGGTISSLSALLASIDPSRVSVDVYSRSHLGPCRSLLTNCTILKENVWLSSVVRSRGAIIRLLSYIVQSAIHIFSALGVNLAKYTYRLGGKIIGTNSYDVVIAYQESIASYVSYLPAKKRIAWIHCDYERVVQELPSVRKNNCFHQFDKIVCVSKSAKHAFNRIYPELADMTEYIYNIVNDDLIREKARLSKPVNADFMTDRKTIVSVGRFDDVKQFDKIPAIAARIKEFTATPFRWYIIGATKGGDNELKVAECIKASHVEDEVTVYPAQKEIYPYIAYADILVNTSRSETFSMVVFEARALGTIPVINKIPIADEVVNNTKDGFICSLNEMPNVIARLLESDVELDKRIWDNQESITSFYKLVEE